MKKVRADFQNAGFTHKGVITEAPAELKTIVKCTCGLTPTIYDLLTISDQRKTFEIRCPRCNRPFVRLGVAVFVDSRSGSVMP